MRPIGSSNEVKVHVGSDVHIFNRPTDVNRDLILSMLLKNLAPGNPVRVEVTVRGHRREFRTSYLGSVSPSRWLTSLPLWVLNGGDKDSFFKYRVARAARNSATMLIREVNSVILVESKIVLVIGKTHLEFPPSRYRHARISDQIVRRIREAVEFQVGYGNDYEIVGISRSVHDTFEVCRYTIHAGDTEEDGIEVARLAFSNVDKVTD